MKITKNNSEENSSLSQEQILEKINSQYRKPSHVNKTKFFIKDIYHIHTHYCGHSSNHVNAVVAYAVKKGYNSLYFSEHCPINTIKMLRPTKQTIKTIIKQINNEQEKYKDQIKLYFGYECEYPIQNHGFVKTLAEMKEASFMVLGLHWYGSVKGDYHWTLYDTNSKQDLDEYYTMARLGLESGYFSWFAHPDIWLTSYQKWDNDAIKLTDDLIALCERLDIPMGFNANGFAKKKHDPFAYPCEYFWRKVAASNVKVLIEADAHDLHTMSKNNMSATYNQACKWGLKNNIIFNVKLKILNSDV